MRLLTPPGVAGVAVVSADAGERERLARCLVAADGNPVATTRGGPPRRAALRLDGAVTDDVLVVDRGDRGLELHLHGSRAVLEALARRFPFAARAEPSPARRLLLEAMCDTQLALAVEQLDCDFASFRAALEGLPPSERARASAAARERSRIALAQVQPARLVLVGAQNAGKSSLFNRLLFRERAATGPTPGLTRDPVRERTVLDGYPYELIDTAGEGEAALPVDERAIARGRELRAGAHLLLVVDASIGPSERDRELARTAGLVIANKSDLPAGRWPDDLPCALCISCTTEASLRLRTEVGRALRRRRGLPAAGPVGGPAALCSDDAESLG